MNQQYKLISKNNGASFELYDLLADGAETTNISAANPDVVTRMTIEFEAWQAAVEADIEYVPPADGPTVILSTGQNSIDGEFTVEVKFSELVTGLSIDDFVVTNGTPTLLSGSGSDYSLTVTPSAEGLISVSLPAEIAQDADSEPNFASNTVNVFFGNSAGGILIDFGRSDNQTVEGNFNNVHGDGSSLVTPTLILVDSDGATTGITLTTDFGSGGSWAGSGADYLGPYPGAVADQPASALQDSMFIRNPASTTLTLTGLDAATSYDILIYGSRSNNGGPNAEWTATDNSGESLLAFDVFMNSTSVASFTDLVPDENNQISILYTTSDDGSRPRGAMGFMRIAIAEESIPLQITDLEIDANALAPTNTIRWTSLPNKSYGLFYSTDLENWEEINDSIPSGGEITSFSHELLPQFSELVGVSRLFYRVALVQ